MFSDNSILQIYKDIEFVETFLSQANTFENSQQSYPDPTQNTSNSFLFDQSVNATISHNFHLHDLTTLTDIQNQHSKVKNKNIKYIQKHSSPEQVFNYYGTNIKVIYQNFLSKRSSVLILPVHDKTRQSLITCLKNKGIANRIIQNIQKRQEESKIVWIKNKTIFHYNEYEHVCLWPVCNFKKIKEYSISLLNKEIQQIFDKVVKQNLESVLFPNFIWNGLEDKERVMHFYEGILTYLKKKVRVSKINLKQVVMCIDEYCEYMKFVSELRFISDQYIRKGAITTTEIDYQ